MRTLLANASVKTSKRPLRILDIGCGDGRLIDNLMCLTRAEMPHIYIEIYGFDISEHGYRDGEQKNKAIRNLEIRRPDTVWKDRIKVISGDARWGYDEGFFDIALTNHVIEHVRDLDRFLENFYHSVSSDGVSIQSSHSLNTTPVLDRAKLERDAAQARQGFEQIWNTRIPSQFVFRLPATR